MATRRDTGLHRTLAAVRDSYVAAVNAAVEAERYELINELAAEYETERRRLCAGTRSSAA